MKEFYHKIDGKLGIFDQIVKIQIQFILNSIY